MVSRDKKGFIRTLEAIIAIVLLLIVSVVVITRPSHDNESSVPPVVEASQNIIVQTLRLDESVRSCVLNANSCAGQEDAVSQVIEKYQPRGYDYAYRLCGTPNCVCGAQVGPSDDPACQIFSDDKVFPTKGEVYMADAFISASSSAQNHTIVRFWMWRSADAEAN